MKYFLENQVSISRGKEWLLEFLYPQYRVYVGQLPPFPTETRVILVSPKKIKNPPPGLDLVQISSVGSRDLADKKVFLEFLDSTGRSIKDSVKQVLLLLEDEEFWEQAKLIWVCGRSNFDTTTEEATVFNLFLNLFDDFDSTYKTYRKTNLPYRIIFSALLTMMLKTMVENIVCSPGYKKALLKNRVHIPVYRKAVLQYIESKQSEVDFIEFLFSCSPMGRAA